MFHPFRNPILLCISRRIIFRSICTPPLPLAFGPATTGGQSSPHLRNHEAPLVPPHQPHCAVVEGDWHVPHMGIPITISFIILATPTHNLASAISLHRSIPTFPPSSHDRHPPPTPSAPHHWNCSPQFGTSFFRPFHSLSSLNYIPAASFPPSLRQYSIHSGRPNITAPLPLILCYPWFPSLWSSLINCTY